VLATFCELPSCPPLALSQDRLALPATQGQGSRLAPSLMPFCSGPDYDLYCGDAIQLMRGLPDNSVDAVVTDPPYGSTPLVWDVPVGDWLAEVDRVLVPHGSVWVFGTLRSLAPLLALADGKPWKHAQEIIWEKQNGSSFHADRFKRVHETAAQFYRGRWGDVYKDPVTTGEQRGRTPRRTRGPGQNKVVVQMDEIPDDSRRKLMRSVIYARSCHGYAVHPTQKPLEILRPLISYSSPAGGKVLDPFAGSGSVGVACRELGRNSVMIELLQEYCLLAQERMLQESFAI